MHMEHSGCSHQAPHHSPGEPRAAPGHGALAVQSTCHLDYPDYIGIVSTRAQACGSLVDDCFIELSLANPEAIMAQPPAYVVHT